MKTSLSTKDLLTLVIAVLALMSVAACSPGTGSSNLEGEVPDECLWAPDQGNDANQAIASDLNTQDTGLFGKKIIPSRLDAVMTTSVWATIAFAKSTGLQVYRVVTGSTHCNLYFSLEDAPKPQKSYWDKASQNLPENVSLLGLFISSDPGEVSYEVGKTPTILVNAAADRWTLVHEMTHANFNKTRRLDPGFRSDTDLTKGWVFSAKKLFQRAKKENDTLTDAEALELAKQFKIFADDFIEFQRRFALEEITIESLLLKSWSEDRLKYHASGSPKNGINYIRMKKIEMEKYFSEIEEMNRALTEKNATFGANESVVAGVKQFQALAEELSSTSSNSERLYTEKAEAIGTLAGILPQNQLLGANFSTSQNSAEPKSVCHHGGLDQATIDEAFGR